MSLKLRVKPEGKVFVPGGYIKNVGPKSIDILISDGLSAEREGRKPIDTEPDAQTEAKSKADAGHDGLILDLQELLRQALAFEFHDFKNTQYSTPKMALYSRLGDMQHLLKQGRYDN
jgi:hypothetical protein